MRRILRVAAIAVALVVIWSVWIHPQWTIRYRLTLDVAVGADVKTGSGVIEVNFGHFFLDLIGNGPDDWTSKVNDAAIAVDLGSRGTVFVMITVGDPTRWSSMSPVAFIFAVLAQNGRPGDPKSMEPRHYKTSELLADAASRTGIIEVTPDALPMLIRFRDINDPKSVERLEPDNLAKAFGPDVKLVRVTAEVVPTGYWPFNRGGGGAPKWIYGVPLSRGIENKLPWLKTPLPRGSPASLSGYSVLDPENPEANILLNDFSTLIR